jgi:prepilin-type N-terminal cleavage/methylation domain-containing protein
MKILRTLYQKNKTQAFTMTEVIVATIIFSLAMAGVFASIANLRQPAIESSQEVTAAFIGKRVLDDLRSAVNAESWNDPTTGRLLANTTYTITPVVVSGRTYSGTYRVATDPDGTNARQVTLNITWE